ncbi:MAG: hypothetical protein J3R72DRAFT_511926 [Linnemannia gamsii]|nr:MAG: hypothetical protein J3R72DRAFT_511926 [Linnemannia gamsii]
MNILQHILAPLAQNSIITPWRRALPFIASPWHIAFIDALLLIFYSPLILLILWPYYGTDPSHELYFIDWRNVGALLWQFFLVFYAFVVIAFVGYVSFFGCLGLLPPHGIAAVVVGAIIVAIAWYLATRPLVYTSNHGIVFPHESWLFVNGVCTGRVWLKLNCEELAGMFGRRIVGINNRTFGFILDLFESIIQRCFGYTTDDARQLYAIAQCELRDRNNQKVVLIAHSQGAIIASLVVDRLLASETAANLRKLELYTFASAANHMHGQGDLSRIEHFVNRRDYFAQTGILSYQPAVLAGNRYDGNIYIDEAGVGHLLNMHYLSTTFVAGGAAAASNMAIYLGGNGGLLGGGAGGEA